MKVSEERLKELVGASGLEPCDFEPVWDSLMVGEVLSMAKELLALRKGREGWKLVPVEPTDEMCNIGHVGVDVLTGVTGDDEYYSIDGPYAAKVYRAMLAAAPEPE